VDLNQDADLLEASTKKNDKYTVRRILDVHYYHFRFKRNSIDYQINTTINNNNNNTKNENEAKQTSDYFKNNSIDLPSIFFNILHLAIEHNAMDVLRICLKYGLDANKSGTILDTINSSSKFENDNKSICNYCSADNKKILKLNNNVTIYNNNPAFLFILSTKQTTLTTNLIEINEPPPSLQIDDINQQQLQQKQVNYSSYSYLVQYPPLFLSISKCNHAATELLLTYGVCTNIKDNFGNTPLHLAVAKQPPCYECVYLLIKHHAKSLVLNNNSQLPSDILNQLSNMNSNQPSLPVNNNNNNNINKTNWDYSINTIHLNLIKDIFKTLETLKNNQTNKLIEENENDHQQQQQQTSSTSNLKADKQRNFFKKSNTQIHNKRNHNNNTTTPSNNTSSNTNKMNDLRPRKINSLKGSLKQKRLSLSNPVSIAAEAETIGGGGGGETSGSGGQHLLLPVVISLDDNDEEDNDVVFDNSKLLNSNKRHSSSELISSSTITVTNQSTTNLSKKKQQKSKKNKQKTTTVAAAASSLSLDKLNEQNTSTSMINFTGTTPSPIITPLIKQKKMLNSLNYVTNNLKNNNKTNNLINDERLMIQKNARYSKPVTAKSAVVVRMATLTQFSKKFTKQNSISAINTAINNNLTNNKKLNDSSILNESFPQSSIEDDYSRSNIIPKINDNVSLVSSKITLFKKSVS